jgi:hypothetical protein
MSDLTTLATLERIVERARQRLAEEGWHSGQRVLELLSEEIKAERAAKPPHVPSP